MAHAPPAHAAHLPSSSPARAGTSWWRTLLTSTVPPAATSELSGQRVHERRLAALCAGLSFVFLVLGISLGLRGAPSPTSLSPTVDAAIVLSRAVVAAGLLALALVLLRMAERFYVGHPRDDTR